jgi:hypothetical protein
MLTVVYDRALTQSPLRGQRQNCVCNYSGSLKKYSVTPESLTDFPFNLLQNGSTAGTCGKLHINYLGT